MNKEKAIEKIKAIQGGSGTGHDRSDFPFMIRGSMATTAYWNHPMFTYGFEYGQISGLLLAFDIKIEDLKE